MKQQWYMLIVTKNQIILEKRPKNTIGFVPNATTFCCSSAKSSRWLKVESPTRFHQWGPGEDWMTDPSWK